MEGGWTLRATAVEDDGLEATSAPVTIYYSLSIPAMSVVRLVAPRPESLFAAPATFVASAELMASPGAAAPVGFELGTNHLGIVSQSDPHFTTQTPPYSLTVSNVAEGSYTLSVVYFDLGYCQCGSTSIRVTKLGVQSPKLTADGHVEFGVVTSFPGESTVIESSPDLADWSPIATNVPAGNAFTFVYPSPATSGTRFYRAVIPSQ